MAAKTDRCYLDIAKKTLNSQEVIRVFETIGRGVAYFVTDEIISKRMKALIRHAAVNEDAASLIIEALTESKEPKKMDIFLNVLEGSHSIHAKEIREVYDKNVHEHKCEQCNYVPPPTGPPEQHEVEGAHSHQATESRMVHNKNVVAMTSEGHGLVCPPTGPPEQQEVEDEDEVDLK